ncbi:hypothetical protein DPMN_176978 [Dreissena polymorpha]|uniref:Uncharacterized protein n=1 Tax=Dreissena polymorpha TaxID=45954 RepID=A0A9D4EA51_DREPO|nr:hypothetical protein DPMN_176978 [Dreissena polymorpha]
MTHVSYRYWTINVASRVLTRKNAPPSGGHVLKETKTIFKLIQDIIGTNLLTKFHEDRKINVASRVLTRFYYRYKEKCPAPLDHVFQPKGIIYELVQDIFGMNLLTKFHEDWTINVASGVKSAPPLGSHAFQAKISIGTNLLTKFHKDWKINVASRVLTRKNSSPPGGHVFQPTCIILDRTINVASRVKTAPPLDRHIFQANMTIFKLIQDIIATNLLTKSHEDWTINVASRVLTRQMLKPHNARRTEGDQKSSP